MDVRIGDGKNLLWFLIYFPVEFFWVGFCFPFLKQWSMHDHSAFIICSSCIVTVHTAWSSIYDLKNTSMSESCFNVVQWSAPQCWHALKEQLFCDFLHSLIIRGQGWENENWCEILDIRLYWLYCWGCSTVASILTVTYSLSLRTYHPSLNSSSHVVSIICCFS